MNHHVFVALIVATTLHLLSCQQEAATPSNSLSKETAKADAEAETPAIIFDFSAHWIRPDLLFVEKHVLAERVKLYYSIDNSIDVLPAEGRLILGSSPYFELLPVEVKTAHQKTVPNLALTHLPYRPVKSIESGAVKLMLRGQLLVTQENSQGEIIKVSQVQYAKLLDALYTEGKHDADEIPDFGARVTEEGVQFKVWSPTARNLQVLLFDQNKQERKESPLSMSLDSSTGVWTALGPKTLNSAYYQYQIEVYHPATDKIENLITTDPYSLSLSTNSRYSQVVDLAESTSKPRGWDKHSIPTLEKYEDSIFYETHVRDFSAVDKNISNAEHRGKYKAFTDTASDGIAHLRTLKKAGVTHIHLLPVFDIATIDEDPLNRVSLDDTIKKLCVIKPSHFLCKENDASTTRLRSVLDGYAPDSGDAQALIESIRHIDDYNWGYDPYHYTVPEGSYATNPEGISRILEFREMIQAIHGLGFRVVMDVVYNHTHSNEKTAGRLHQYAVLDTLVPNYYNRLNPKSGEIENSTCCANTASEHVMMGKLMIDSLLTWTQQYKIDGFRFDLMGHQPKALMLEAYNQVRDIDPDNYFYGEGWNFGEVANNSLFVQATQQELAGSEIGTFSDRLRDAIRGPGFNSGEGVRKAQGIGNGLYLFPNERRAANEGAKSEYLLKADQLRVGLAGNLANFPLTDASGKRVLGKDVPYGNAPTGYALDPADTINYVSKHDNQTLWDNHQYRLPFDTSTENRVRLHLLSLAYPIFAQGIPFIHMGSELLRSKSFLRDSYDYGDWFNKVDFGMSASNYNVGLPPAVKDADKWNIIREVLNENSSRDTPTRAHIRQSAMIFNEFIRIRASSDLFRLNDEKSIINRISFLNSGPEQVLGLIAMEISDEGHDTRLDSRFSKILILFNNDSQAKRFPLGGASTYKLHPIQALGYDTALQLGTSVEANDIIVPAFSAAVFVKGRN